MEVFVEMIKASNPIGQTPRLAANLSICNCVVSEGLLVLTITLTVLRSSS